MRQTIRVAFFCLFCRKIESWPSTVVKFHELIRSANITRQIAAHKFYLLLGNLIILTDKIFNVSSVSFSELLKQQKITVQQKGPNGEIWIKVLPQKPLPVKTSHSKAV
jgi:chromatin segregation and condensation protein Rec8/ScpA/Scc1 (kleisin family)